MDAQAPLYTGKHEGINWDGRRGTRGGSKQRQNALSHMYRNPKNVLAVFSVTAWQDLKTEAEVDFPAKMLGELPAQNVETFLKTLPLWFQSWSCECGYPIE